MLHLNRFQQHQCYLEPTCDYVCISCQLPATSTTIGNAIETAKAGDIINIYGGNPALNTYFLQSLKVAKHKQLKIRLWTNHFIEAMESKDLAYFIDELVIWCPSPHKVEFNELCGRIYFDWFKASLKKMTCQRTLSFVVRPLSFESLPDFYDLVVDAQAQGMILYYPREFSKEQRRYIKRFKRVNNMRVMPLINAETPHCLAVPNSIGSFHFEWHDWLFAMRNTLKRWPLIKYTV